MASVELEHSLIGKKNKGATNIDLKSLGTAAGSEFRPMTAEGAYKAVGKIGVGVGPGRGIRESADDRALQLEFENLNEQARLQSDYANNSSGVNVGTDSTEIHGRRKLFNANGTVILPHDRIPRANLKSLVGRDAILLSYD